MVVEVLGGWSTETISKSTSTQQLEPGLHVCACASAVRSEEMMGRQQRGYSLVFGAQPMCL